MPRVTVLLPVYNGEKYLQETMQSILGQSYTDFEFLIVDDGSFDESLDIVRSFQDPRIRVLKNPERLKLAGALNRGMGEAKGKFIARMDADDIALPQRLEKQVAFMERYPEVGVCGTAIEFFGKGVKARVNIYPADAERIKAYALFDCPFCHPAVMIRKNLFLENKLHYDGSYYPTEDYELWARATALFPTANLDEVLLRYRIHGASMTGSDWEQMDRQATRIIGSLFEKFGIKYTEEQLKFHRNIGRGRSCRFNQASELDQAETWLRTLIDQNQKKKMYDRQALVETISLVWYRLCFTNTFFGLKTIGKYLSSSLAKNDIMRKKRSLILLLSVLKNRFVTAHSA